MFGLRTLLAAIELVSPTNGSVVVLLPECQRQVLKAETLSERERTLMAIKKASSRHAFEKGWRKSALPIWMAVEVMTFGTVEDLYRAAKSTVQQSMAKALGVRDVVLMSWLKTLRSVRNLVAHHGRLWNRVIRMKPLIPAKGDLWRNPVRVGNDRVFCVLCICRFLLRTIAPQSKWQERLEDLFAKYPDIALADLGFPSQWKTSPLWQ